MGFQATRLGPRTPEEEAHFRALIARRGHNVVEPSYIPDGPFEVLQIESAAYTEHCIAASRPKGLGDTTTLFLGPRCKSADETSHWMWHTTDTPSGGHIRPALRKNMGGGMWGRIMCLTGENWRKTTPRVDDVPITMVCNPGRPNQRWLLKRDASGTGTGTGTGAQGVVYNPTRNMCLSATSESTVIMQPCNDALEQKWKFKHI